MPPPSRRTVMPLTGTHRRIDSHLSFPAYTALQLAIEHLARSHRERPTASALVRVALLDFCDRLQAMDANGREREACRVRAHSKAYAPAADDVIRAATVLEACAGGTPLPTLQGVLSGPSGPLDAAALEASVNARLKALHPRKFKDLA